jgi:hypothetical protein
MSSLINFNYYLFCVQQLKAVDQQIWSEEDLALFRRTVVQYIVQFNIKLQNWSNPEEDLFLNPENDSLLKPELKRTITVESPFVEDESTGNICDLNGNILATYHTLEERQRIYAVLVKEYEHTSSNKVHM